MTRIEGRTSATPPALREHDLKRLSAIGELRGRYLEQVRPIAGLLDEDPVRHEELHLLEGPQARCAPRAQREAEPDAA
jgi:hypothetical protein